MNNPYGFLLRENHPLNLIEAQKGSCKIEEHVTSSYPQILISFKETTKINEIVNFMHIDPMTETFGVNKTYLKMEEKRVSTEAIDYMINFVRVKESQNSSPRKHCCTLTKEIYPLQRKE
jgi:hypothetical protein